MDVEIKKLTPELLGDWLDYFDNNAFTDSDDWPGCYCMHFHWTEALDNRNDWGATLEQVYRETGKADNRARAVRLIKSGTMQGYLAYLDGKVVGWCNANDKRNYKTVNNSFFDDTDKSKIVKAIVCFVVARSVRGRGVASKLVEAVCSDALAEGYEYIEAYPYCKHGQYNDYPGSATMYKRLGFQRSGERRDDCYILRKGKE